MSSSRDRRRVVVAWTMVVLLVVGVGGAAIALATSGSDDAAPTVDSSPTLQLSRTSSGASATAGYQLTGSLDDATGQGVVISPAGSTVGEPKVRALLGALGMTSPTITEVDGGWTATGTAAGEKAAFALDERAGNLWQYGRGPLADCLFVRPGAQPDDSVSCTASAPTGKPAKGPGRAALLADAEKLFALVGVTPGSGLRALESGTGTTSLDVPLTIEGLPVVDVTVSVGVDADGIISAIGLLDPTYDTVGKYSLVSAETGLAQLQAQPVPDIAPDCGGKPCPSPTPAKVTDARLAWLTTQDDGSTVLVPAWQYEVDGFYGPAVVAVDPRYLAPASG